MVSNCVHIYRKPIPGTMVTMGSRATTLNIYLFVVIAQGLSHIMNIWSVLIEGQINSSNMVIYTSWPMLPLTSCGSSFRTGGLSFHNVTGWRRLDCMRSLSGRLSFRTDWTKVSGQAVLSLYSVVSHRKTLRLLWWWYCFWFRRWTSRLAHPIGLKWNRIPSKLQPITCKAPFYDKQCKQ